MQLLNLKIDRVSTPGQINPLCETLPVAKTVPTNLTIWDIAGLVRNASSGAGLGNKFLNDIRQVDGILQIVRGFVDDEIVHIEDNKVDPVRDLVIVNDELILKDLEIIELEIERVNKMKTNQELVGRMK